MRFTRLNPTRLMLLGTLRHGPARLRLVFMGERRAAGHRVPADLVTDAERSEGGRTLSGVLNFGDRTYPIVGFFRASSRTAEVTLDVAGLGRCVLHETQLPRARLQPGLSLNGAFEQAPSCQLELRLDFKQIWRDLY